MAKYYGVLEGSAKKVATRCGSASSGLVTIAASWSGAVQVRLYEEDGVEMASVSLIPWHGAGTTRTLYTGPVNGEFKERFCIEEKPEKKAKVHPLDLL